MGGKVMIMAKRILICGIALLLTLLCAVSCKSETTTEPTSGENDLQELYDTVVLTIDGTPITYEKYRYYFYGIASTLTDENKQPGEGVDIKDLREAVLQELRTEQAIATLAERYGISVSDEEWATVDSYLTQMDYYYQTSMGTSLEEVLAANYGTLPVCREVYAFGYYISDAVYEYMYNRENGVVDFSEEKVRAGMEDVYCTLHILLTKDNYTSDEDTLKIAEALTGLLKEIDGAAKLFAAGDAASASQSMVFDSVREAYARAKEQSSFVGSFSPYMDELDVLEKELTEGGGKAAAAYLKEAAAKLDGEETAVTYLKRFAEGLPEDGISDASAYEKDYAEALTLYEEYINTAIDAYAETSDADFPESKEMSALFGMRLVGAVLNGKVREYALETLQNAFAEAVRIFGEDREDPRHGVYFKKGETDEDFENAYFALAEGEIGGPVKTSYGVHVVLRQANDFDYFKEKVYEGYAVSALIDDLIDAQTVTYEDIYETITMDTLE